MNNFWSFILGNMVGDRLHTVINAVLAAIITNRESETLPAPSSQWASMERQRLLVLRLQWYVRHLMTSIYKQGYGSLNTQICMGYSCYNLWDSNDVFHLQSYHYLFVSLLVYKSSPINVYRSERSHNAVISHDGLRTIVDTPLMHIYNMGQEAFFFCFFVYRQLKIRLWLGVPYRIPCYPRYTTNNDWHCVDAHSHIGVRKVLHSVLPIKAANDTDMTACNLSAVWLPWMHNR